MIFCQKNTNQPTRILGKTAHIGLRKLSPTTNRRRGSLFDEHDGRNHDDEQVHRFTIQLARRVNSQVIMIHYRIAYNFL